MRVRVIVNPNAGAGRAKGELRNLRAAFEREGRAAEIVETRHPGHATELTRQAAEDHVDVLAVMGGDGTLNEVVQGYLDERAEPVVGPELGVIPFGTGGDFRRSLELDDDLERAVHRIVHGRARAIDLGRARLRDDSGRTITQGFVNVGSVGLSGVVCRLVNTGPKWLGGRLAFYLAAARATLSYRNAPICLDVDGRRVYEGPTYLTAFANGRYFGGGMLVAPEADLTDGCLDAILFGDLSRLRAYGLSAKIYRGAHLELPEVRGYRGRHFVITPGRDAVPVELDGETPGTLPLEIDVLPRALHIRS